MPEAVARMRGIDAPNKVCAKSVSGTVDQIPNAVIQKKGPRCVRWGSTTNDRMK